MLVQNKGDLVRAGEGLRLVPGTNNVDEADWKAFVAHPLNKHLVESGELIPQETVDGAPKKLSDLNAPEAAALVKDTFDLSLLAAFLNEEESRDKKRTSVIDAIKKQAEEVEKSIEDAKKQAQEENE